MQYKPLHCLPVRSFATLKTLRISGFISHITYRAVTMKDYIIDEEEHLSPAVVGTTVVLIAIFGLGLLYQLVTILL